MTDNLYSEVRKFIQDRIDQNIIVRAEWATAEILAAKTEPECEDADFYLNCAHAQISEVVKRCIGKYQPKPTVATDPLPGFEHLQRGYLVEREGARVLVPTDLLSDAELLARADEYDAMARGCRSHASELREFVARREANSGAA